MRKSCDVVIAGSGFAGSLMAMIARRLGYSVVLLERGRHPRVVIGESSTPLANLLIEELSRTYELPTIAPLSKWGTWQKTYRGIACGLKRGFTFYHHEANSPADPRASLDKQLMVAASPHDDIADMHWYRADFDAFLVGEAKSCGVDFLDEALLESAVFHDDGVMLRATRAGTEFSIDAKFLIDATGPRGMLHRALNLEEEQMRDFPSTEALWSHFEGAQLPYLPHEGEPYPPEDAAVHHVFDGGWVWVLQFNNGITSAGIAATEHFAKELRLAEGEAAWKRLLAMFPALGTQFEKARTVRPFQHIPRVSCVSGKITGERWAMLPSAAGFVDPLLSTGFPLTLLGIERMAKILEAGIDDGLLGLRLTEYAEKTRAEFNATTRLISALYANMSNFDVFRQLTLLYFAAASFSESARRLGKPHLAQSFLLHDHPQFGPAMRAILDEARSGLCGLESAWIRERVRSAIEPIDVAGLNRPNSTHRFPVRAEDLLMQCAKLESTPEDIKTLLERCGFYAPPIAAS